MSKLCEVLLYKTLGKSRHLPKNLSPHNAQSSFTDTGKIEFSGRVCAIHSDKNCASLEHAQTHKRPCGNEPGTKASGSPREGGRAQAGSRKQAQAPSAEASQGCNYAYALGARPSSQPARLAHSQAHSHRSAQPWLFRSYLSSRIR